MGDDDGPAGRCESVAHREISPRETIASSPAAIDRPSRARAPRPSPHGLEEGTSVRSSHVATTDPANPIPAGDRTSRLATCGVSGGFCFYSHHIELSSLASLGM